MTISNPSLTQISQALAEMLPKLKPLSVPTGMISAFNNVPEGWLQCNGAAVSRTTYAALFAVIGTKYGSGDGSTTFNLPNLHHKFIEGTTTQSEVGQSVSAGLPNITGILGACISDGNVGDSNGHTNVSGAFSRNATYDSKARVGAANGWTSKGASFSGATSSSVFGSAVTVQPASLRLIYCIKS